MLRARRGVVFARGTVPVTPRTLREAIRAERRDASRVRGVVTRAIRLEHPYHEVRYDPARLRGPRGEPVEIDQGFEGSLFFLADGEVAGVVLLVDDGETTLTVRLGRGDRVPPAAAFTLWPVNWLDDLHSWAENLSELPPFFADLPAALSGGAREDGLDPVTPGLRPGQAEAVAGAARTALLLWGPPGTGKTHTLGAIAASLRARGETLLGISVTNVAVDRLALAIDDACTAAGSRLAPGELIRAGRPRERALAEDPGRRHLLRWSEVLEEFADRRERIRRKLVAIDETLRRQAGNLDEEVVRGLKAERAALVDERMKLDAERAAVLKKLAENARIVVTTAASWVMNRTLHEKKVSRLLVDEASMVPLAAVCRLLHQDLEGAVFAGDFRQLPPIARAGNRSREAAAWFGQGIFEHLEVDRERVRRRLKRGGALVMLTEQGRMNDEICRVVSETFYDGSLVTVGNPPRPPAGRPVPAAALVVVDPARASLPHGARATSRAPDRRGTSWTWDRTAALARHLVERLLAMDSRWPDRVIVVSPYRAQARLLERLLSPLDPDRVKAGTIHGMQGDEADIVIFDPVRPAGWFLLEGSSALRLVNVAISRARGQVFLLGRPASLADNPYLERFVEKAVEWIPDWEEMDLFRAGRRGTR